MDKKVASILPGILFFLAGIAFIVAGSLSGRGSFNGVGAAFIGIGGVFMVLASQMKK